MEFPGYRKITADQLVVVPWKNGGGLTTEIASGAARADDQAWSWRISVADVGATGAFSAFPGIDRTIAVVHGNGMDLQFEDGRMVPLELNQPVDFDGDAIVTGILRGEAIRDFNVMVDRRYYCATLRVIRGSGEVSPATSAGSVVVIHMLDGACTARTASAEETLSVEETMICEGVADISVSIPAGARAAIVVLEDVSGLLR
jgi:environmental stress-induced protein Ves